MKTLITFLTVVITVVFTLTSCDKEKIDQEEAFKMTEAESAKFFETNIAVIDARVRSINKDKYVREFYLANFSKRSWDKKAIVFENYVYLDNGQENDIKANDGIFTSVEVFNHNSKVPYSKTEQIRSVLEAPIISTNFTHHEALQNLGKEYNVEFRSSYSQTQVNMEELAGPVATIECDVSICSTGCLADKIYSELGCLCFKNCRVKIGWE